jgi:hypothetical protein
MAVKSMFNAKRGKQVNSIVCCDGFAFNIMASRTKRMIASVRLAIFYYAIRRSRLLLSSTSNVYSMFEEAK